MTRIFFYYDATDRLAAMARLISKAVAQKKALVVYAPLAELAEQLDRQLWLQPPIGFTPHVRQNSPLAAETPVVIASNLEGQTHSERLFNLSNDIPPSFARFQSLIEVVGQSPEERHAGRERVRFYKDRGYELNFLDLTQISH